MCLDKHECVTTCPFQMVSKLIFLKIVSVLFAFFYTISIFCYLFVGLFFAVYVCKNHKWWIFIDIYVKHFTFEISKLYTRQKNVFFVFSFRVKTRIQFGQRICVVFIIDSRVWPHDGIVVCALFVLLVRLFIFYICTRVSMRNAQTSCSL